MNHSATHLQLYAASWTRHAAMWRRLRGEGWPIISTWIDEADSGKPTNRTSLWRRCVDEASRCDVLILFVDTADGVLSGALIEVGAALAFGRSVIACGSGINSNPSVRSFVYHPNATVVETLAQARSLADQLVLPGSAE